MDRIQDIISDLLSLAWLETGHDDRLLPVDVAELVTQEIGERAPGLPIHLDLQEGLVVGGATGALARLLGNLLDNAERHGRSAVRVTVSGMKDEAVLTVDDDGQGIPLPHRELVFEHFTRLDSARDRGHGGAGLGLPIARAIAQAHGGTLTAGTSDMGGGPARLAAAVAATGRGGRQGGLRPSAVPSSRAALRVAPAGV
ncbi:ATP-binding protein [Nonomuraea sp. NPDC050202]|uniref:sensor histidine kinase n=1 Tax=Nonomuraea sp. NPDC050202 TaxID=3155035 RepID=UPI0033F9A2EF